jgi:O-succinylbenzoic acid--CoA ligase
MTSPKGTMRLATQTWPATAIGAAEFRRTQAKKGNWLHDVAQTWLSWCKGNEPGMVVQTSGSTGAPKTIEHSRAAVLASVRDTLEHWDLRAGTKAVLALPTSFVAGQAMLIRAIEGAWDLELVEPTSSPSWNAPKDFVALTPHQAQGWLQQGRGKTQTLLLGGGPISASLVESLLASGRVDALWESYGLSESITHVATRQIQSIIDLITPFTPLTSANIKVDERGCAVLEVPSREVHALVTNDCIEMQPDGRFVWLGRADDVVNSGGVLVHPSLIARAFESIMPNWVSDWAAFGRKDQTLGEAMVLRIEGTPPAEVDKEAILNEWRSQLKSTVGPAKAPRVLEWGTIPRTKRGKLNRRALK